MTNTPKLPVTGTVTAASLPASFSVPAVVALARDLALGLYEEKILLQKHGISPEQYEILRKIPYFQQHVEQQAKEWNAPRNAQERLANLTAVGLEEVLPTVIARTKVPNEPLTGVAQLVKVLADMCGATNQSKQHAAPTEKFKIVINLGADQEVHTKTKPILEVAADTAPGIPDHSVAEIRSGLSSLLSLQTQPEAPRSAAPVQGDPEGESD